MWILENLNRNIRIPKSFYSIAEMVKLAFGQRKMHSLFEIIMTQQGLLALLLLLHLITANMMVDKRRR